MKIIALYSIKGGVGKTASAVNLAYLAAREGARTLLCDLDPQGSASFYFRIRPPKKLKVRKLLRGGRAMEKHIRGTDYEGLDLLPSNLSFRNLDIALDGLKRSKKRFGRLFRPLKPEYDFVFLDCPPNITLVSENVFAASDLLLVPVIPTTLSALTYEKLMQFFGDKGLDRSGVLAFFSMVERRKNMHREVIETMSASGRRFLNTRIPYLADVEKMGLYREPVPCYRPRSAATAAYGDLWGEVRRSLSAE